MKISYDFNGVRKRPFGVPNDYQDLYQLYPAKLDARAADLGTTVESILTQLSDGKVLDRFRVTLPDVMSTQEAAEFIGVNVEGLRWLLKQTARKRHSGEMKWNLVAPNKVGPDLFWGPDLERLGAFLDQHGWDRSPVLPKVVTAFKAHLTRALKALKRVEVTALPAPLPVVVEAVVAPPPPPAPVMVAEPVEVPSPKIPTLPPSSGGLPMTNDVLVKMYGDYVFKQVRHTSKIKTEEELQEACQQVWLNLFAADILGKFAETARTKLPRTLTLFEAVGYLGITTKQWVDAEKTGGWMPKPVSGSIATNDVLYLTADIQTLDESGFLKGERNVPRRNPEVTGRGFKSYLAQAVKNHFFNMMRTRRRKHKERGLDPRIALSADMSGMFRRTANIDDATSWEENLTDEGSSDVPMEDLLDLVCELKKQGVDPRSSEGLSILDSVTKGSTLKTAIRTQMRAQAA